MSTNTELIARLQSEDATIREETVYQIEQLGATAPPEVILPLIELINDPAATVRYTVIGALAVLKPQAAVRPLIEAIPHNTEETLGNIAEALGNIGDLYAVEPLIGLLTNDDPYVRVFAAEALGKLGDPRAVEPLISRLSDVKRTDKRSKDRPCDYAVEALQKINTLEARIAVEKFKNGEFAPKPWWKFWK